MNLARCILAALLALWAVSAASADQILIANRASGNISIVDSQTNQVSTVFLPAAANPVDPMYFTFFPTNNQIYVGDRGNDRLVVFNALDWSVVDTIPVGKGVFHQWGTTRQNQLWVVNDQDKSFSVIDMTTNKVIKTVALPADLAAGTPHDLIMDPRANQAFITVNGLPGPDVVLRFSTDTFLETGRLTPGDNLHVGIAGKGLYVAAQDSNLVAIFDKDSLTPFKTLAVSAAHGADVSPDERFFYTTNITGGGPGGLITIDTLTNTIIGVTDTPFATPHNIAVSQDGTLLFLTHSGPASDKVSFYTIGADGIPVFAGVLTTGNNPFAILAIPNLPEPSTWALFVTAAALLSARWGWRRYQAGD
jgi:YVTN family beta-propeller protein